MTTETQILRELVEAVNRPDWWAIGITAVNALFLGWLAWRQYQLQKQQTKLQEQQIRQQEYDIYRKMYALIKGADKEIDTFLEELWDALICRSFYSVEEGFYKRKQEEIESIKAKCDESPIDFELKISKDFFDVVSYKTTLSIMSCVLGKLDSLYHKGYLQVDVCTHTMVSCEKDESDAYIEAICSHINSSEQVIIRRLLTHFVEQRAKLREDGNDILEKIRERCKVE